MNVAYRTFALVGLTAGLLGAGYIFLPQPGAAALPTASVPKAVPVASAAPIAAPTAKPSSTLVANRAPVPMAPRTHDTYFAPKTGEAAVQNASATTVASGVGATSTDGGVPPAPGDTKSGDSTQAKAAIELDGYKNVRGLEKGPDGIWRGRAMRGRTEITVRVDATGSVSAD